MEGEVLRFRSRVQVAAAKSRLRPLAMYKPSFSLNNNNDHEEGQALLGPASQRCMQPPRPPPVPARRRREVAPSDGWFGKLRHDAWDDGADNAASNCCCGAVALPSGFPWARTSTSTTATGHPGYKPGRPSRPSPDKHIGKAMNTRGIFSHTLSGEAPVADPRSATSATVQRAVYRGPPGPPLGQPGSPTWTSPARVAAQAAQSAQAGPGPAGGVAKHCSSEDERDDDGDDVRRDQDGVKKMLEAPRVSREHREHCEPKELPPLPPCPFRRRILVRPKPDIPAYFRLTVSPSPSEDAVSVPGAPEPAAPSPSNGPMDRFNKFRFGSRVDDKERPTSTSNTKSKPSNSHPHGRGRAGRGRTSDKTERLRELTERLKGGSERVGVGAADRPPSPGPSPGPTAGAGGAPNPSPSPVEPGMSAPSAPQAPAADAAKEDDLFDLQLARPESRAIVGSYIQRTIPFRSASFSQVDFSPTDGKYVPRGAWLSKPLGADRGAATLPRKKTLEVRVDDLSPASSPASSTSLVAAEPATGSTPSVDSAVESAVDSAVGSDEGYEPSRAVNKRSMTLPTRGSWDPSDEAAAPAATEGGEKALSSRPDSGALTETLTVVLDAGLTNSCSSLEQSDVDAPNGLATPGNLSPPILISGVDGDFEDIKPLDNPVSYEVFVRQFPNYKEYEKWMNESVLVDNSENDEWRDAQSVQVAAAPPDEAVGEEVKEAVEHDDRCINNFDPSTCPKCLEQMETGPSILQKLKASFHMEDMELEPHEKELYSRHTDIFLRKWPKPEVPREASREHAKPKHPFERSKSEPKETSKEGATFQRTKSTAEDDAVDPSPGITLPSAENKDSPDPGGSPGREPGVESTGEPQDHADEELKRRRPEPRRWLERPKLICQSSDERDDDGAGTPPRPRFPTLGRSDSLSEGESDQGTPSRASPSLYLSDSEGRAAATTPTTPPSAGITHGAHGAHGARSPHAPRRYSKRPLRGPYGQMLEAEMKKPEANRKLSQYTEDLKFLEEYPTRSVKGSSQSLVVSGSGSPLCVPTVTELTRSVSSGEQRQAAAPRNRGAGAHSMDDSRLGVVVASAAAGPVGLVPGGSGKVSPKRKVSVNEGPPTGSLPVCHQRTTSSPSQLEGIACSALRSDLDLFRRPGRSSNPKSGEHQAARPTRTSEDAADPTKSTWKDTRTHVVVELYETERSYVESLDFLVKEYMQPLKKPENAGMVDSELVEQIFYQVPAILSHHKEFLDDLQKRLENWDFQQKVGDVLLNAFTKRSVIDTYTAFINNWKTAKEAIKSTCQAKPAFARYLEAMAREHKGKLALDSLLIMPVQRIPRYELLIQTLLKHTDPSHADHSLLLDAQREVHELAVKINCTERETLEAEQQQQTLRDLEAIVEGCDLVSAGRVFLRHDLVTLASGQGTRKERVLFLFSDLVVIARIKRNLRKPSGTVSNTSVASGLEGNRYRCSMKAALDDLEILKAKDESLRRVMREMEQLAEDVSTLTQITELASGLHLPHLQLEELARDLLGSACRQLADRQNSDSQLSCLDLTVNTSNGVENITVIFTKPDKRASWEEAFNEAKTRLALSADRRPSPKFKTSVPIRKTRAGLQFTCAAPTLAGPGCAGAAPGASAAGAPRDVWVCNSDGYVGQVCVLSLLPEPNVTSCNGVCNARILCVAAIPAGATGSNSVGNTNQGQFTNSKAGISISVEDTDKAGGNLHLDSSSSSDEEDDNDSASTMEERFRSNSTAASGATTTGGTGAPGTPNFNGSSDAAPATGQAAQGPLSGAATTASSTSSASSAGTASDDGLAQPTMWLGTEDGCIHVYSCNDNIRIKRNKVKIQHGAAVHCIMYFDNRVFVSLANGDITVYSRDQAGGWNTTDPLTVTVGSAACPVTRMVPISGRLWCSCQHTIKVLNTNTLQVEQTVVAADSNRAVTYFVVSGLAVWLSVQNSAILKLYHASTFEHLGDVNVAPAVTKMLASCDDIIRQHKAACLRVTSLLACKDLLWIGTSAGVILTMPLPHIAPGTTRLTSTPNVSGVPHGHTGHVRFLTVVEATGVAGEGSTVQSPLHHNRLSWKIKSDQAGTGIANKLLIISGGDGYEDFRTSSVSEVAGKEDSTNHLLMWQV